MKSFDINRSFEKMGGFSLNFHENRLDRLGSLLYNVVCAAVAYMTKIYVVLQGGWMENR